MTLQLPLERFNHWLDRQPDAVWLRQPVNGVWHDYSWLQVDEQARRLASALLALGCVPGERVALLAKNCAEWFISDLAIQHAGLVSVPLYPLQAPEQIAYVLEHAGCKVILVGKLEEPDKLASGIAAHITRIAMPYRPCLPSTSGTRCWPLTSRCRGPALNVARICCRSFTLPAPPGSPRA